MDKQIAAAEVRVAIAENELENHDLQIQQSQEVDDFLNSKYTNEELYDYMVGQISSVYFQSYQLAFNIAKKAEKCFQYELGIEDTSFINFGYWDSLKKGLLSGEKLQFDLRRLENAYLDQNNREYEITKHVSIILLDPLALIKLRSTGACDFDIPEVMYDMDHAGQYFRRIKSVSISLPCIAGPYTSVSANLSLVSSRYRKNTDTTNGYAEDPANDDRFHYNVGSLQSISTSNAQNDSGIFELNFRDERYLPFEGYRGRQQLAPGASYSSFTIRLQYHFRCYHPCEIYGQGRRFKFKKPGRSLYKRQLSCNKTAAKPSRFTHCPGPETRPVQRVELIKKQWFRGFNHRSIAVALYGTVVNRCNCECNVYSKGEE